MGVRCGAATGALMMALHADRMAEIMNETQACRGVKGKIHDT